MSKDKNDKKIGSISSSQATKGVKATESVAEVDKVKATAAITGVSGVSGIGKAAAIGAMSFEQRERLMAIVSQETEKLANQGAIPKSQRDLVEAAVKMAIDGSLVDFPEKKK